MFAVDGGRQVTHSPQFRQLPAAFWVLLALTAAVRLIGITRPLLGSFATKNVVYGMIARNWAEGTTGLWYPTLDVLPLDVLRGAQRSVVMVEFPVSAYVTGWLWSSLGGSLDVWGRATAVAFSVASVAAMFLLVGRRHGPTAATAAAAVLAVSPVSIIYGQAFMLEASLVFFTLAAFYAVDRWVDGGHPAWLAAAGVCLGLLLLTKIYMLLILLPLAVRVVRSGRSRSAGVLALVAALLATLPAAGWYLHAAQTASPEGPFAERVFYSVRQSAEVHRPPHPLLWSADFYRQVLDDLGGAVLTPVGLLLALAGLLDRRWRQHAAWLLAMALLVAALPRKFYEMNYYYMAVLPPLCVMAGLGWQVICQRVRPGRTAVTLVVLVTLVFSFRYAFRPAFVTPDEDRGVIAAARALRQRTLPDEPVVTIHGTTIDLLYYCDRPGWAIDPREPRLERMLEDCRRRGARYVVVVGEAPILQGLVLHGDNYRIHRLHGNGAR